MFFLTLERIYIIDGGAHSSDFSVFHNNAKNKNTGFHYRYLVSLLLIIGFVDDEFLLKMIQVLEVFASESRCCNFTVS